MSSKLKLNLEAITSQIDTDIVFDSSNVIRFIGALGLASISEAVEKEHFSRKREYLVETAPIMKKVVRDSKIVTIKDCPEGYKVSKNGCVKMLPSEVLAYSKRAIKAAKSRSKNGGFIKMLKERKASMALRDKLPESEFKARNS